MSWWRTLIGRGRQESKLLKELDFHVEERVADLIGSGLAESEARRRVRHEFGGLEQVREQCRDVRPGLWLEWLVRDLEHSLRAIRQRPVLALTIVLTVAACVAVNTAVFTVVDSLLLRPLSFDAADRLISMTNQYPKAGIWDQDGSAAGDYIDREGALPAVAEQALYQFVTFPVDRGGAAAQVRGLSVTPSFFPLLRVRPAQGRLFAESESEPGKYRAVILTDGLWREMFGGAEAVGHQLRINGQPYTVAGVLPAGFRFIAADVRYFLPLALSPMEKRGRHANGFRYLARLRDGATVAQAQAQVDALNARVLDQIPAFKRMLIDAGFRTRVDAFQPWLMRRVRSGLWLLWAGAFLVLLVGGANLAGLSLARAYARVPETAARIALGATRGDVIRQCLVDGVVPALVGGLLGIAGGILALRRLDTELLPGAAEIGASPVVLCYALGAAVLAGVVSGLVSLIPLRRLELARAVQNGSRAATVRSTHLRRAFVVAQVALAFVLLNGTGILTASIRELFRVDPGFRIGDVWTASTYLPGAAHSQASDLRMAMDRITSGVRELAGVELAGGGTSAPFSSGYDDNVIFAEGYTMNPGESAISPIRLHVTPGYLETLGVGLTKGRLFDESDTNESRRVVIVDEKLARRFWPNQDPVGRRMYYPGTPPATGLTVVGVVRSIRLEDLAGSGNANGIYYLPWSQGPNRKLSVVWRGRSETVAAVRKEFSRLAPGAALFDVRSMAERRELTLSARRAAQTLVLIFASVAVLLTAIGINGLLAFLVTQKQREIGIRLAIGSRPIEVFRLFLRDGVSLVIWGLLAGLGVAAALKPWVVNQLYGVAAVELSIVAIVAALITVVSIAAIAIPAYRAARLDPIVALREN